MCGIVGIISHKVSKLERDGLVSNMNQAIFHRGPDEFGTYSDEHCSLGMRRLSIIDLGNGSQPIFSWDRRYLIFFNGEIYNYPELKADLQKKGIIFSTNSDTEVIVNLFSLHGMKMITMLQGMFAFCIYDLKEIKFYFGRDRFGEKPFFYYFNQNQLVFSSELKSILESNLISPKLNLEVLDDYLSQGYVKDPNTLYQDIFSLSPGHYLEFDFVNGIKSESYFSIKYQPDNSIKSLSDASEFIKPFFEKAVQKQLISDVPVGAFLSGGIDSSSVVAMMKKFSTKTLQTFTVKFKNTKYDESSIAREVATSLGTKHTEILVQDSGFKEDLFWRILDHVGVPFPDSSAIPTDFVTNEISKHVKVAVSGDGGDEVFGGYTVFDWISQINKSKYIPKQIRELLRVIVSQTNKNIFENNKLRQLVKLLEISKLPLDSIIQETQALFSSNEIYALRSNYPQLSSFKDFDNDLSVLRNSMLYRLKYDLCLDMLVKVDRMSMANSLEVRSPFLDPDLFDASCKLPDQFLRQGGKGKMVIREMMKNELPISVFEHPKSGFSIPLHDFKNESFKNLAIQLIGESYMSDLFNKHELNNILERGLSAQSDNSGSSVYRATHQLWSLMMLSGWIKRYNVAIA